MTRYLPLIISIDSEGNVIIYIDRAHAVHIDTKEYSSLFVIMGKGAMINILKKLKLIITSSTETEVVLNGEYFLKCT